MECQRAGELSVLDRRIAELLFLFAFVVYAYFYAGGGWNQHSQFDLTRAIVERQTFAIDAYAANTGDVSRHAGRTYSNKSPGLSWLAAIPYAFIHAAERLGGLDPGEAQLLALNHYLCTLFTVAPFGALIPALLYVYARRRRLDAGWAALVAITAAIATQLFPYSTFFILHVPSGALLLLALVSRRPLVGGLSVGIATVMNYLCAPAIVAFALLRRRRELWPYAVGTFLPLSLLAIYQQICFGSFATLSIAREDERFLTTGAVMGVFGPPSLEAIYGITFSPYRGLFFFAPVLLMIVPGTRAWLRSGEERREMGAIAAVIAAFFLFNVTFNGWEGGFGIGARYLVPVIPLLALAMLRNTGSMRRALVVLAMVSFGINFTAVAVDPQPSGTIPRPLTQYLLPLLVHGQFSPSVPITPPWSAATFTGHTSVNRMAHDEAVVFTRHPPGSLGSEWSSFNLGEPLAGAGSALSLVPILLLIVAGVSMILRMARRAQEG